MKTKVVLNTERKNREERNRGENEGEIKGVLSELDKYKLMYF